MNTPESMKAELSRWNNGAGIDLEAWTSCTGNFSLAVGYLTVFWPTFVEFEGYILRSGFTVDSLREFEKQAGATPKSVEAVLNHLHIALLHQHDDDPLAGDKVAILGEALCEIYRAKLAAQFPRKPCTVELYRPDKDGDIHDYQLSFWQTKHEK
jgi:hypothetical protein